MTLTELQARIKAINFSPPPAQAVQATFKYSKLSAAREKLFQLAEMEPIRNQVLPVLSLPIFDSVRDAITVSQIDYGNFQLTFSRLVTVLSAILEILPSVVPPAREDCVRVKLPTSSNYKDVVADQAQILQAFEQLLYMHPGCKEAITIEGWENGSLWVVLGVGVLAVEILGRAMYAAAVIRKKIHEGTIIKEQARKLGVEANFREHLQEKAKVAVDAIVETEANAVYDAYFKGDEPSANENRERLKKTLRTLADLIDRGGEVHPALMQPEKAQDLFPDYKHLETVTSVIKQLGDGSGNAN